MIEGVLKDNLVFIDKEGDASTLRNKGFNVKRKKGRYYIDIISALYLLSKKKIRINCEDKNIEFNDIFSSLNLNQKMLYSTFCHMKNIGIKCIINSGNLYAGRKKVKIYHYSNNIKISDLGSGFLSIVDSDFESLLYSIKNENFIKFDNGDPINFISALSRKFLVRSGAKFGGMLRVYIGNEKHSNMILNLRETEEANSLIAKARVAHSVKKKLVYCFPFNSKIRCLSVNWFH